MQRFFIIVPFMNYGSCKRRSENFSRFIQNLTQQTGRASILVVECALEGVPFVVTNAGNPLHIQLTTNSIMYRKENLINIGVSKLPSDWKYVAWVDEGVEFLNPRWIQHTIEALKRFSVVQLFDKCNITSKEGKTVCEIPGFAKRYMQKRLTKGDKLGLGNAGESSSTTNCAIRSFADAHAWKSIGDIDGQYGIGWAMCHKTWDQLGGLYENAVGGGGDVYMAYSFIGQLGKCGLSMPCESYKKDLEEWSKQADIVVGRKVGFVRGVVQRGQEMEDIEDFVLNGEKVLNEEQYSPARDMKKDLQGLQYYVDPRSTLAVKLTEHVNKPNTIY